MGDSSDVAAGPLRLPRGERTRRLILERSLDIASAEGLDRLSFGRIAGELGLSKSGVSGHFADQTDLQLAVIAHAAHLYVERVVLPAWEVPAGMARVRRFCELWVDLMRDAVLTGRCFFLTAMVEFDARPGRVRDEVARLRSAWGSLFAGALRESERLGEIASGADVDQVFFEVFGWISAAVIDAQLTDNPAVFARANSAISSRLALLTTTACLPFD